MLDETLQADESMDDLFALFIALPDLSSNPSLGSSCSYIEAITQHQPSDSYLSLLPRDLLQQARVPITLRKYAPIASGLLANLIFHAAQAAHWVSLR